MQEVLPLEPLGLPARFKGKDLGMVIALKDTTVPYKNQLELQKFWRPQVVYEVSSNHFWGIMRTWLSYQNSITQFFIDASKRKLKELGAGH